METENKSVIVSHKLQHIFFEKSTELSNSDLGAIKEIEALCNEALLNAAINDKYITYMKFYLIDSKLRIRLEGVERNVPRSVIERFI